jgi:hypothetical protein
LAVAPRSGNLRRGRAAQAALAQSCNATALDLFKPRFNVSHALHEYMSADAAARGVVPHPGTGFTFFLPSDAAYGNDSAALGGGAARRTLS